jgi:hypothetical protein
MLNEKFIPETLYVETYENISEMTFHHSSYERRWSSRDVDFRSDGSLSYSDATERRFLDNGIIGYTREEIVKTNGSYLLERVKQEKDKNKEVFAILYVQPGANIKKIIKEIEDKEKSWLEWLNRPKTTEPRFIGGYGFCR